MVKTTKKSAPSIADTFKALSYCMSNNGTRGSLCCIHVDCADLINFNTFTLVATDGHIMLHREMLEEDWGSVRRYMKEEHNADLPMVAETMSLFTDKKMRTALKAPVVEMESDEKKQYLPYPKYRNVIPTSFERPPTLPLISTVNYAKIEKIQKLVGYDNPIIFEPDGWNSMVGAVVKRYGFGFGLLAMPLRPSGEFTAKIGVQYNHSYRIL